MKLFIAEKPSVAKAIAAELGVSGRGDGFINCRNDVVVTWCFGHLLEQAEPDAYLPDDIPKTKKGRQDLAHAGPAHLSAALADGGEDRAQCEEAALGDRQIAQVCGNGRQRGRPRPRGTAPRRRGARALQGPTARRAILGFGGGPRLHPKRPRQARRQLRATRACATPRADAPAPTGCSA